MKKLMVAAAAVLSIYGAVHLYDSYKSPAPLTTSFSDVRMVIRYKVTIGRSLSQSERHQVNAIIEKVFNEVDTTYNQWNPKSEISTLNRAAAKTPFLMSEKLSTFIHITDRLVKLSELRFDPTVEPLVTLWKKNLGNGALPDDQVIQQILPSVGWNKLEIEPDSIVKISDTTEFNMDGVAKGYLVDRLVEELNEGGFQDVYVEWGGEIRASGQHPEGRPWRVLISKVGNSTPEDALEPIDISGRAVATSGDYYQQWTIGGKRYTHIVNPQNGQAMEVSGKSIASATVVAPTCAMADVLATTCMTFDTPDDAREWAERVRRAIPETEFWIITRD